jgi:hypothetical protein
MKLFPRLFLALPVVLFVASSMHAQEPLDSDAWKSRCLALNSAAESIDKGSATPELLSTTKAIAGAKFAAVAHERAGAGQHYIACTLYYTAAMAERMGNGGKIDPAKSHSDVILGGIELKHATGEALTFKEKMEATSGKVTGSVKNNQLSPVEVAAVFAAFSDAPTDVAKPPPPGPAGNSNALGGDTPPPTKPKATRRY